MIPSRAEIISSTIGGARLLFFKADGLARLKRDAGAPLRSFFAWVLCLPALLLFIQNVSSVLALEDPGLHFYALWLLEDAVSWLAFPVLLLTIARPLPLRLRVPSFIQATNWMGVSAQYLALAAGWLSDSTLLPNGLADMLSWLVLIWLLAAEWWLARRILAVTAAQALLLVLVHFMLSFALQDWAIGRSLPPL